MAAATLHRNLRRRTDLPHSSSSAYRCFTSNSLAAWSSASLPLYQSLVRPSSSAAAGAKKSSLQHGTLETAIEKN